MAGMPSMVDAEVEAYLSRQERKGLLRFITCGSVDDGKSTLIGRLLFESKTLFEDQLAALAVDSQQVGHARRRHRLRAARRRPLGRARAGHHDRRRLPLLLDRPPQVHRRRHARPRAVHAQHGHRRVHRRPGDHPDRRAQGRADADAAAQLPGVAARHPARRARRQQDGPHGLLARRSVSRIEADYRAFATQIGIEDVVVHPDVGGARRQRLRAQRARCPGITGPSLMEHLETVPIEQEPAAGRSACRCSG